jgi:hypothetical protein
MDGLGKAGALSNVEDFYSSYCISEQNKRLSETILSLSD